MGSIPVRVTKIKSDLQSKSLFIFEGTVWEIVAQFIRKKNKMLDISIFSAIIFFVEFWRLRNGPNQHGGITQLVE